VMVWGAQCVCNLVCSGVCSVWCVVWCLVCGIWCVVCSVWYTLAECSVMQLPPLLAKLAMSYASGAFKSPNMCNLLLGLKYHDYLCPNLTIECPVLLLWGDEDTILCPRDEQIMLQSFPKGEGYWVEGGSHMLVGDSVLTVCDLMEGFLDRDAVPPVPKTEPAGLERLVRSAFWWTSKTVRPMARLMPRAPAPVQPGPASLGSRL